MNATTYSTARAKLSEIMDRVCDDHDPCIITRCKGKQVVIVNQEDYEDTIKRCSTAPETTS
ncbi:type II toxin-antitoxin system Phd/YefM family antitoxin [Fundidesulfovibrio putealis]|uniref:type II toxin-antitoxin system Phd/YefM family antitoxin n=1 Tax=Fundidesulfovibrio putealis TaxID=270496 RepID=UPI00040F4865|nr:type II toxin-antitoxin system Phd/YefM family antitoxin [Fundidesulfovibrio putealis]